MLSQKDFEIKGSKFVTQYYSIQILSLPNWHCYLWTSKCWMGYIIECDTMQLDFDALFQYSFTFEELYFLMFYAIINRNLVLRSKSIVYMTLEFDFKKLK